jgi:glycosyltransferase involved in cell wall biosynthesis
MRIFHVINHAGLNRGGAERLVRHLHEDLCSLGDDSRLIAVEECDLAGLEGAVSLGFSNPYSPAACLALGRMLRAKLRSGDVVHAHLFPSTLYISLLRRMGIVRTSCAMTAHSTWTRRQGGSYGRAIDRVVFSGFDHVVAVSEDVRAALSAIYSGINTKSSVITNGVTLRFAAPPCRSPSPTCPILLSVARLVPAKNIGGALLALALLKKQSWRYVVVGDGPERGSLELQAMQLGLADRVHFAGWQEDVTPYLAGAEMFLMPSRHEGFGMAAVEAMNAAIPVVAADIPGLREVVAPAGALLVPPDDTRALATAIAALLADGALRTELGHRAYAASLEHNRVAMALSYRGMWQSLGKAAEGRRMKGCTKSI